MGKCISFVVLGLLLAVLVSAGNAGPLATDPAAYIDGSSFQWHGTTNYSSLFISDLHLIQGSIDWAVYAPGSKPAGYVGYASTPGEFTYAYQLYVSGPTAQLLPVTGLVVSTAAGLPKDNIGAFTGDGGNGAITGNAVTSSSLAATSAQWNFTGIGPTGTLRSVGLVFSSPLPPRNRFGTMVNSGSRSSGLNGPLPSPTTTVLGDYNGNGSVGNEDYSLWKANFGLSNFAADGSGNGTVDAADYVIWRDHFGQTAGSGAFTTSTVPEPSNLAMLIPPVAGWRLRRRRAARD